MSAQSFADLAAHNGHDIECVLYGNSPDANPQPDDNAALECMTCSEVLLDFTRQEDD